VADCPLKRKSLSDSVQGKPDGSDDKRSGDAITLAFGDLATGLRRPGASAGRSSRGESRVRGRCSTAKMRPDSRNFTGKPQAVKDLHSAEISAQDLRLSMTLLQLYFDDIPSLKDERCLIPSVAN
jgi:hypothetical protein